MQADDTAGEFVQRLAEAPTLDALPQGADPVRRAPLNPPQEVQQKFVGSSYVAAYAEAEKFVDRAFEHWPPGDPASQTVLDFGSGWGRITRMLLRRLRADQVWSSDVDPGMTVLLNATLPGINAVTNTPWPPSVFRPGTFDAITAFSVFSHLSERAHRLWAAEFARITRPGSRVYITVLEDEFFAVVAGAQAAVVVGEADTFTQQLARVVPDALIAAEAARSGQFVYADGDTNDDGPRSRSFYAWAVAPRPWVETVWGEAGFAVESWAKHGELFDQAMVVLVRTDAPAPHKPRNHFVRAVRKGGRILSRFGD